MAYTFENRRLCVDFVATRYGTSAIPVETVNNQFDLRLWIEQSGVLDRVRPITGEDVERARAVRDLMIEALFPYTAGRRRYQDRVEHRLNAIARRPRVVLQFRGEGRVIRRGGFEEFLAEPCSP